MYSHYNFRQLHRRVVQAIAASTHALRDPVATQALPKPLAGKLTAKRKAVLGNRDI